jgi:hypothetical protein
VWIKGRVCLHYLSAGRVSFRKKLVSWLRPGGGKGSVVGPPVDVLRRCVYCKLACDIIIWQLDGIRLGQIGTTTVSFRGFPYLTGRAGFAACVVCAFACRTFYAVYLHCGFKVESNWCHNSVHHNFPPKPTAGKRNVLDCSDDVPRTCAWCKSPCGLRVVCVYINCLQGGFHSGRNWCRGCVLPAGGKERWWRDPFGGDWYHYCVRQGFSICLTAGAGFAGRAGLCAANLCTVLN